MKAQWQAEKDAITRLQDRKAELEDARGEAERATRAGDLQQAAEIRYGKVPQLEAAIADEQGRLQEVQSEAKYLKEEVGSEDVAEIVARWTGIPVSRMLESERERLTRLEDELHRRVVGQDEAVSAVANAVRRARAGLQDPNRPVGSFIFLGPTGVGKTETARALAEFLFDDERALVRLDMSEYGEKHSVARMLGAPPGYIGFEEGGQLTEAVRRRPYSVVLFDEIEKAHPEVFDVLLQILDDGRLTDGQGRTVDFRNTVLIMTSNLGGQWLLELGQDNWDEAERHVRNTLRQHFKPEFLNRVDDIVVFRPLTREHLVRIVDLQLERVAALAADRGLVLVRDGRRVNAEARAVAVDHLARRAADRGLVLEVAPEAKTALVDEGYDPAFGARPLKRVIQRRVQNPLALSMLEGEYAEGDRILVVRRDDAFAFERTAGVEELAQASPQVTVAT